MRGLPGGRTVAGMTRIVVALLLAVAVAGCGGGGEGDAIRSSLEQFGATGEPRACEVRSARFLHNTTGEDDVSAALRLCRRGRPDSKLWRGRSSAVSAIVVQRDRATANVLWRGGDFDGQNFRATLVKVDENWKVDRVDGVRIGDSLRSKLDGRLRSSLEQGLRDNVPPHRLRSTVECAIARGRRIISNDRLAAAAGGHLPSRALSDGYEQAATGCLAAGIDDREYAVAAPRGWRDITKQAGGARFDLVLKRDRAIVTVIKGVRPTLDTQTLDRAYAEHRARTEAELPRVPEPTRLDGVAALAYTFLDRTSTGEPLSTRQVLALRGGIGYLVSFGAAPRDFAGAAKDFDAVLASWRWK